MQGLYDIYKSMNSYMVDETWSNDSLRYSFQNISYMKTEPVQYFEKFISTKLMEMSYNDQVFTLEYNQFLNKNSTNNLTFMKQCNLLLGIQIIFNPYVFDSGENANFQSINDYLYSTKDEIFAGFTKQQDQITEEWKDFIDLKGFKEQIKIIFYLN